MKIHATAAAALFAIATLAWAGDTHHARIVGITDGDTVKAVIDGTETSVRLAEIDAPEKAQPWGARAKEALSDLCFQKMAEIRVDSIDRYRRPVARVVCNGKDASRVMVSSGYAWVFDRYVKDHSLYAEQRAAKEDKRGLWADPSPTPPWEWRKARRNKE